MSLTLETKSRRFPPIVCFLLARHGSGGKSTPMSIAEISERSGLSVEVVTSLSWQVEWGHLPVDFLIRFSAGCGVDLDDRRSLDSNVRFLQKQVPDWPYLSGDPQKYRTEYEPRIRRFREWIMQNAQEKK
jgi:hypothetical protein